MKGIGAVIFDFNGVLVDDESVHFALFREVLAQEEVVITERDYHERYLGYDDRRCFEAALLDAGQDAGRERLDKLIARKAQPIYRGCGKGNCDSSQQLQRQSHSLRLDGRWRFAQARYVRKSSMHSGDWVAVIEVMAIISAEDTEKCKPDPTSYQTSTRSAYEDMHGTATPK